ncbi:MAG: hypothetical protein PF485_13795 [Bacteroidales bacterium]|jgi:hypothetical protein|nr:hypothetical protein [Bacteroidales bacterium]
MDKLYFKIGCCVGKSFIIEMHYNKIIYSECFGKFTKYQKSFEIDTLRQENFIKSLDILHVWSWKQSYINPNETEGLQWEFEIICKNGEKIKASGSNRFPDSDKGEPSSSFLSLISSIENLVNCAGLINLN